MNKDLQESKPKITIEEVRKLYNDDMKNYEIIHNAIFIDFKDYCRELEVSFEITY